MPRINRVAVTGASGLIGTALVAQLKNDGYQVQKLVRRPVRTSDEVFGILLRVRLIRNLWKV